MRSILQYFTLIILVASNTGAYSMESNQNDSSRVRSIICHFEANVNPRPVNIADVEKSVYYPLYAKHNGSECEGTINILVGSDGSVIEVSNYSGGVDFKEEVLGKIMMLKFTPAISGGKPVQSRVTVPFRFRLKYLN